MSAQPAAVSPQQPSRAQLHASILTQLALALEAAAKRLHSAAAGQSTFASDADLKATLALLKLAPDLLPLLSASAAPHRPSPPPPPAPPSRPPPPQQIPLIPKCTFCGKGPGAHWSEDCALNPNRTGWNLYHHTQPRVPGVNDKPPTPKP